ncbi:hypothetical protein EGW08_013210 [Elysia chlorotica]|uniref:Uncharacterized protein n=1 Tax=Elysia chlorotica TaxID=188477 RepID=A0A433TBP8_ELYCH|nr:hypothetical protein EGW08_013210 [Elysia chlorotica]
MEGSSELSDSELPHGLPSDDEDEQSLGIGNEAVGIKVPVFINKLREAARPLLSLSKGVPSPTKQLKESGLDKLKESRAKKRLFRGKQEPPNGVIERRYGYIPNPRWGKLTSRSNGRQFVPQGVEDGDSSGVPGVVFRDAQPDPTTGGQTQELEFPQLNNSRLSPMLEASSRNKQPKRGKLTQCLGSAGGNTLLEETDPTSVLGRRSASPMTSTPVRWGDSALHSPSPGLGHSSFESNYHSAAESVGDSPKSIGNSIRSTGSNSFRSANMTHSFSSANNSRSVRKLAPSPLAATPISCQGTPSKEPSVTGHHFNSSSSFNPQKVDGSRSDNIWNSPSPPPGLQGAPRRESPALPSESNGFSSGENKWSQRVKRQSLETPGSNRSAQAYDSVCSNPWPPANSIPSSPWGGSAKARHSNGDSKSAGMQFEERAPHTLSSSASFTVQDKTTQQLSREDAPSGPNSDKPDRQRKNKQKKTKSFGNAPSCSSINDSQSPNSSPVAWQQRERKQYSKPKNSGKGPSSHFTLENFITPQKVNGKKNGIKNDKKDILLENRFVEHIAANPTSPPKKVRPSPIKKLSFANKENNSEIEPAGEESTKPSAAGDADSVLLQDCGKLEALQEYIKTEEGSQKDKTVDLRQQPSQNSLVFSMKRYFKDDQTNAGDTFEEENEDEDEYPDLREKVKVQQFWRDSFAPSSQLMTPRKHVMDPVDGENEKGEDVEIGCQFLSPSLLQLAGPEDIGSECGEDESFTAGTVMRADPTKVHVHHKKLLTKLAQRYCHYFEEHQVPNIAVELYFITQLLTCTEVDKDILDFVDLHNGKTVFRSVHNGVCFAVKVIRRLRRLFASLGKAYLELLVDSQRIKDFSPYLHKFFKQSLLQREEDPLKPVLVEHSPFNADDDGTCSFPDANYAHVFKCQRDNFYAFYRHYHDTSSVYEFKIENQIQYVYDGCTPEQNSMVNLMHLAKLYVNHLVLCCVTQRQETVNLIEMIHSKGVDEKQFERLYEAFFEATSASSGTACPPPGFPDHQMFFRDFLETLSSPAFNEHLKNILVMKILELNSQTFSSLCNLHSAATLEENKTPLRCRAFTDTVLTLCILAKVLGYLTFAPYTSGFQSLSQGQAASLLSMREMTPLPLPLSLLLKQAFEKGHLCLTVPWMVQFLSQMDCMAPQLSVFHGLLKKLHFIQRYAWDNLYREGHTNSGLLIVSCISWLFESPPVPAGFFYSCNSSCERTDEDVTRNLKALLIDRQKLVCQHLLTSCCPYLEEGQVLMTLFALKQKVPVCDMAVIPLSDCNEPDNQDGVDLRRQNDIEEIEKWLGTSLHLQEDESSCNVQGKKVKSVIDDEVVPSYVLTRLLARKDTDDLEDMEVNLLLSDPFMKSMVENAVDLLCAKVAHYTQKTILRLLVFTCKAEVRQHFRGVQDAEQAEHIKNQLLTDVNLAAARLSDTAKTSFYQVAERVCQNELPSFLKFLSSIQDATEKQSFVHVARKLCMLRLREWSGVQLGTDLFRRTITQEAKRCARVPGKPLAMYPNDYSKKSEEYTSPEITPGFVELEQLSELIDTALSHGVWYINALTPGQRPNSEHMIKLINDFISCVHKRMITMDFAFYVMSNFLMHLIIQYMVDAPFNWTEEAERAFVQLCVLCKERKLEADGAAVHLPTGSNGRKHRPGLRMKVKVLNLLSVHTLSWLAKTQVQDETMMVYCRLLCSLVVAGLLHVETVSSRLSHSRSNKNLSLLAKTLANRALVKVLSLLYWSIVSQEKTQKTELELEDQRGIKQKDSSHTCGTSHTSQLGEQETSLGYQYTMQESYSLERVTALVVNLWSEASTCHMDLSPLEKDVQADLVARLEVAFGNVLVQDGSVCSNENQYANV